MDKKRKEIKKKSNDDNEKREKEQIIPGYVMTRGSIVAFAADTNSKGNKCWDDEISVMIIRRTGCIIPLLEMLLAILEDEDDDEDE